MKTPPRWYEQPGATASRPHEEVAHMASIAERTPQDKPRRTRKAAPADEAAQEAEKRRRRGRGEGGIARLTDDKGHVLWRPSIVGPTGKRVYGPRTKTKAEA